MKKTISAALAALLILFSAAGCAARPPAAPAAEEPPAGGETVRDTDAAVEDESETLSRAADAAQMTEVREVVEEGMTPVYGEELLDGTYGVAVESSSSMFRIERCELTVENGSMTAFLTMSSDSYGYLYLGTAEAAASAGAAACIAAAENEEGKSTFLLPVEALDAGIECAAWSRNKELWYSRTLVFRSDSLPPEAFRSLTTAESLGLPDGAYTVELTLSGGSGKASVASPARAWVRDGVMTAEIVWSSANYDYMRLGTEIISTEIVDGHSVCVITVPVLDRPFQVTADTTAMSQPHEIAYTLTLDAASIRAAEP